MVKEKRNEKKNSVYWLDLKKKKFTLELVASTKICVRFRAFITKKCVDSDKKRRSFSHI